MKNIQISIIVLLVSLLVIPASAAPLKKSQGNNPQYREGELLVKFRSGVSEEARDVQALSVGAEKIRTLKNIGVEHMRLPKGMSVAEGVHMYEANPNVEYAEPNYIIRADIVPDDTNFDTLWGLNNTGQTSGTFDADIDAPEAWDIQTGSPAVIVAVMDSGIDYNHPDLVDNIWQNPGEASCSNGFDDDGNGFVDDCRGWDFVDNDNTPLDLESHGTHVAGTIGAVGNNGEGVTGVAWTVSLMNLRVLDALGEGTVADAVAAINYAKQKGAHVVNCSWGGPNFSQSLKNAIDASAALFVCAAGNSADNTDITAHYPSGFQSANIISVAATDHNDNLAPFSNYGPLSVDVAAPGLFINSTIPGRPTIFTDNFEGILAWATGGTNNSWGLTMSLSNSPTHSLTDSPGGNYINNTNSWAKSPILNFSGKSGCSVSYEIRFDLELGSDFLCVEASDSGIEGTYTILDGACWTGSTQGDFWSYTENLSAWDGDGTVHFRFRLKSDDSFIDDGAYIDDVKATCASDENYVYTGEEYTHFSGTSMSAPHVSGVAALLIANIPSLSALDVKNVIIHSVDTTVIGAPVADWSVSNGRVNAFNALAADPANLPPIAPSNLRAFASSPTSVTLTWLDNSDNEDGFSVWRKDGLAGSFTEIAASLANTVSYSDAGLTTGVRYTYRVRAFSDTNGPSPWSNEATVVPSNPSSSSNSGSGGISFPSGCFIATAAYGSPLASEVKVLKEFRDEHLMHYPLGQKFVKLYYAWSPNAARVITRYPALRGATRAALYPVVFSVKYPGIAGGIMVVIISAALLAATRRKRRNSCDSQNH